MRNGKAVVLVVDDDSVGLALGRILVTRMGYEALEAEDADEAIRILEANGDIDLVFTDVQMPGSMDGVELCQYIRHRWPSIKLIVASGLEILESRLPIGSRFFSRPYGSAAISDCMALMLSTDAAHLTPSTPTDPQQPISAWSRWLQRTRGTC